MTRITEIAAVPANVITKRATPRLEDLGQAEINDRAKQVKPISPVDTAQLSGGEMAVQLKAQKDKILSEFWDGTVLGDQYRAMFYEKDNALYNGLHTSLGLTAFTDRFRTAPASGWLTWEDKLRTPATGLVGVFNDVPAAAVGNITQLDCKALFPLFPVPPGQNESTWLQFQSKRQNDCELENEWRSALNQNWAQNSHYFVYEFLTNDLLVGRDLFRVQEKRANQKSFITGISKASKISRSNLSLWLDTGILANNIQGANGTSLGPLSPREFIEGLRDNAAEYEGIGFPFVVIPIALAVLALNFEGFKRLIGVIKGKESLKQAIRDHALDIFQLLDEYGDDIIGLASTTPDWTEDLMNTNTGDEDCPDGFEMVDGECKPKEANDPPKFILDSKIIGGGLLALGGLAVVMMPPKERPRREKG
jgi:hypothetical protein